MGKKISDLYAEIGVNTTKGEAGLKEFKKSLIGAAEGLTGLGIGSLTAGGIIAGLAVGMKKAVDQTEKYNLSIRNLAQNLGITTEETSRVVQTADDFGIQQAELTTALQMAVKLGFAPSINSIAKLADVYNSIQDPLARADEMVKRFGRNWTVLTPMLREGSAAIKANAASIEDSLIVTQKSADAARNYQKSVDGLTDAWQGFTYMAGNAAIPTLTNLLDGLNKNISIQQDFHQAQDEITNAYAVGLIPTEKEYWDLMNKALSDQATAIAITKQFSDALNADNDQRSEQVRLMQYQKAGQDDLNASMKVAAGIYSKEIDAIEKSNLKGYEKIAIETQLKLLSGQLTEADLAQQITIGQLTAAYEQGGMTSEQYLKALQDLATGMDTDAQKALELARAIAALKSKSITVTTRFVSTYEGGASGTSGNRQSGGPVMAGKAYIVGEKRPELFVPNTSGAILPFAPSSKTNMGMGMILPSAPSSADLGGDIYNITEISEGDNYFYNANRQAAAFSMAYVRHKQIERLNSRMGG